MASPTTLTPPPVLDQRLLEPRRHHWRRWLIALAVTLAFVVVAGLALDVVGLLPGRGPLSSGDAVTGVSATFEVKAGDSVLYPLLYLSNTSRVGVVLDSVEPIDATPGVRIQGAWLFVDSARCRRLAPHVPDGVPQECRAPLAGYVLPGHQYGNAGSRVIVELDTARPGTFRASGFNVRYHVGPIHYTTTFGDGYVIHATAPSAPAHRAP